ncbi:hypothetical protein O9993_09580 [Vibrio lentus]|nr:hypothetical protein [Vibrio lentus]
MFDSGVVDNGDTIFFVGFETTRALLNTGVALSRQIQPARWR